jgi:RNA polymerase sigma-70 factor, ECF subfamily
LLKPFALDRHPISESMTYVDRVAAPLAFVVSEPPSRGEEAALIRRAQERDMRAFEHLYRTHVGRVHAICLRMTANATRAEELTQKAFLLVWEKLPLFRGESAFSSWLHRVAVNTVLADLRAEHRRTQRVFTTDDPAMFETAPRHTPAAGIRLDLEQAIALLPPQARAVFVLHDVEGWQHNEIAEQLGVATGTSKAQLHRARKLLQEALQ